MNIADLMQHTQVVHDLLSTLYACADPTGAIPAANGPDPLAAISAATGIDPLAETPKPKGVNTEGILTFLLSKIAPIFLAVLGVIFIARASKGEVSKVVTSSAIAIVGVGFIVGAATLLALGGYLVDLFFS